jgi:type I restriction-modification system DNA methylase subunit
MALNWNEIKSRAIAFSQEWADTKNEEADAKPFLVEFFNVFGISSKRVSSFEYRVKRLDDSDGYIDLLWKGTILIEMKSRGKNLDRAYQQAKDYLHGLKQHELPQYILVSDFEHFRVYDLESTDLENNFVAFDLKDLASNVQHFGYLMGYQKKTYKEQDPANIKAAELMGRLHDRLEDIGYTGHPLEVYLVRVLFCLFAEDTSIFQKQQLQDYISQRTNEDGSDLASKLQELFQVLNTPNQNRFKNLDEQLAEFPYINGKLFEEALPMASFDSKMRQALLDCCYLDWSKISPAIFGSMFQAVMNPKERRNLGAHYTSETNILKVIKPLFLDELWAEFQSLKDNKPKLAEFHKRISTLKFLDPACGCGNFLVITYRELRLLELEILRHQYKNQTVINIESIIWLDVDMVYGIEYEEFPARIAEVAMWLIDHQMNIQISQEFGQYFVRLPLNKAAKIVNGDALRTDWQSLLNPINEIKFDYIIGNPPFIGSKIMSQSQRDAVVREFDNVQGAGVLDYVTAWYIKAAKYIENTKTKVAFVSTNSIVQGEQTGILWGQLLNKYKVKIHFAHRTFKWSNEAKGNAAVYCVIVGFANFETDNKRIFDYENLKGEAHEHKAKNINPYLVDARDILIGKRQTPICNVPQIAFGNMPNDGGNLLLSDEEKNELLLTYPELRPYIRPLIGAYEYLNGIKKWCFWLVGHDEKDLLKNKELKRIIENVRKLRNDSTREATRKLAKQPTLFGEIRQPETDFVYIPLTSSENRTLIPMGFCDKDFIVNNTGSTIPNATLYHFGILQSQMHFAWVKYVCGRLKSDFRYSNEIVYNNFPWPVIIDPKQKLKIETLAQKVLDARKLRPHWGIGDFYDPLLGFKEILKAHNELDKAVDLAYRSQPFTTEASRMEFLFDLYEKYTADLFTIEKKKRTKK